MSGKHPEIEQLRDKLQAERAGIVESTKAMHERREELRRLMQPYEDELRKLTKEINTIERPRLAEIDNQLGALARSMGGRSMKAGG